MTPEERAEAVMLVIRGVLKLVAKIALVCFLLVAVVVVALFAFRYVTEEYPESQVDVLVSIDNEACKDKRWPIRVFVGNGSYRTLESITFYLKATKPRHSKNLTNSHSYESDRILPPKEGYASCWAAPLDSGIDPFKLKWEINRYYVSFMEFGSN
ncbi:hypothetical protein [Sneathiella glossodoripedis]|uniref:hypothetical protein n=1 Tax=Sneathiella glossodoripedis TaxID=418853 RepID=UPI00046FA7DA|nr:hypothetical protein [Sneathiella glossodoripedis]